MKTIVSILTAILLTLGAVGCGDNPVSSNNNSNTDTTLVLHIDSIQGLHDTTITLNSLKYTKYRVTCDVGVWTEGYKDNSLLFETVGISIDTTFSASAIPNKFTIGTWNQTAHNINLYEIK